MPPALTWALALASVAGVSLVSLVGVVTLGMSATRLERLTTLLVSFAVGSLLGDVFIHLLPEIFEHRTRSALSASLLVVAGLLLFFLLEKVLRQDRPEVAVPGRSRLTVSAMSLWPSRISNWSYSP